MRRVTAVFLFVAGLAGTGSAYAQDSRSTEGRVVVTIIPGGATFFTEGTDLKGPSFGNYNLGGAIAGTVRHVGLESEVSGTAASHSDRHAVGPRRPPYQLQRQPRHLGARVETASSRNHRRRGWSDPLREASLRSTRLRPSSPETWAVASSGIRRWGLRGDYRFIAVQSRTTPEFFGLETRYGHRVYGAFLVNIGR
jgi:hypothetical protein